MDKRGIHGTSEKKKKNQEFIQMPRKKKIHLLQTNQQYTVIFFRVLL